MGVTMNDKSANLISAYHDGELTAAERANVEQLLASSPEARAELESFRTLSSLLREAGRPALESDLTPVVMQMIEQRMLLPETAPRPPHTNRKAASWTKWVVMIAAAAAGLVIAVRVIPQNPAQAPNIAQQPVAQPIEKTVPQPEPVAPAQPAAVAVVNPVTPEKPAVLPAPQLAAADIPLEVIENLKRTTPGKIVRFLKQSGDDVTVFHLMVLDIQPGLVSLQMILSAQQITESKDQQPEPGIVAVYVQANQDQLDKVIAELQSEEQKQFVALAVQAPVKAEEIQKLVKSNPTELASQQVPLKKSELTTLGVNPVQSSQIVASRSLRGGRAAALPRAMNGDDSPLRKLLIVVEKAPESLLSPTNSQPN